MADVRTALVRDTGPAATGTGARRFSSTLQGDAPPAVGGGSFGDGGLGRKNPKGVLFAATYGRLSNIERNYKFGIGFTDGIRQIAIGSHMADSTSPTTAFNQSDDDRYIYVPGACEAAHTSFDKDAALATFLDSSSFPKLPNFMMTQFGGDDMEVKCGIANVPSFTASVDVNHGLSGQPTGFIFISTGKPLADGSNRNHVTVNIAAASWNGVQLRQGCHGFFSENGVTTTATAGQLRDDCIALDYNLTDGGVNNWQISLSMPSPNTQFRLTATDVSLLGDSTPPGVNGDVFWIAFRGTPCELRMIDMPETTASDWNVTDFSAGEPPMWLMLLGTMLFQLNTISTADVGSAYGLAFVQERFGISLGARIRPNVDPATSFSQSELSTDAVRYPNASGGDAFSIDPADQGTGSFQFKSTGWTVPAAKLNAVTTGPRKAMAFIMRAPPIGWETLPAVHTAQGSGIAFTATPLCAGTVYAMLLPPGSPAPTASVIIATVDAQQAVPIPQRTAMKNTCKAYSFFEGGFIGITSSAYDMWVTLADNAGRRTTPYRVGVVMQPNSSTVRTIPVARVAPAETALPYVLDAPLRRMYGMLGVNTDFSSDELSAMGDYYVGIAQSNVLPSAMTPDAAAVAAIQEDHPSFFWLAYINSKAELSRIEDVNECEGDKAGIINYYQEGSLALDVNDSVTTIRYTKTAALGLKKSTIAGDLSTDIDNFPGWFGILSSAGFELVKLPTTATITDGAPVVLTGCTRGYGGTTALAHTAGAVILAPLYVTATASYPGGDDDTVRYVMRFGEQAMLDADFFAARILEWIEDKGRTGPKLDLFTPNTAVGCNAFGVAKTMFNFDTLADMTKIECREKHLDQLVLLDAMLPADTVRSGNNGNGDYRGSDGGGEAFFIEDDDNNPKPLDFWEWEGCFANPAGGYYSKSTIDKNLGDLGDALQKGYGVVAVSKCQSAYSLITAASLADYLTRQFYDCVLLNMIWDDNNIRACVGTLMLVEPDDPGSQTFNQEDCWNFDLGNRVSPNTNGLDVTPLQCAEYNGSTNQTYRVEYSRAVLLANVRSSGDDSTGTTVHPTRNGRDSETGTDVLAAAKVTMTGHGANVYFLWDFLCDVSNPLSTVLGTVAGITGGTAPFSFSIVGAGTSKFQINAVTGAVTLKSALTHITTGRYGFTARIEDVLGAVEFREYLVVTQP